MAKKSLRHGGGVTPEELEVAFYLPGTKPEDSAALGNPGYLGSACWPPDEHGGTQIIDRRDGAVVVGHGLDDVAAKLAAKGKAD